MKQDRSETGKPISAEPPVNEALNGYLGPEKNEEVCAYPGC